MSSLYDEDGIDGPFEKSMATCACGCHSHHLRPHVRCFYCGGFPDHAPSICYREMRKLDHQARS